MKDKGWNAFVPISYILRFIWSTSFHAMHGECRGCFYLHSICKSNRTSALMYSVRCFHFPFPRIERIADLNIFISPLFGCQIISYLCHANFAKSLYRSSLLRLAGLTLLSAHSVTRACTSSADQVNKTLSVSILFFVFMYYLTIALN